MKIFVVSVNGVVQNDCFTSLKSACEYAAVCYSSAKQGKRTFKEKTITETELIKIKGRGNNGVLRNL